MGPYITLQLPFWVTIYLRGFSVSVYILLAILICFIVFHYMACMCKFLVLIGFLINLFFPPITTIRKVLL